MADCNDTRASCLSSNEAFGPSADIKVLKKRAQLLQELRAFFYARDVMEVDTPVLSAAAVTDVYIESLKVEGCKLPYLQTSPEFYMKRLLASGCDSIFYLGKAFRREENGRLHRHEFTMLEWYRIGFTDRDLINELVDLFMCLQPDLSIRRVTYGDLFKQYLELDPYSASVEVLKEYAQKKLNLDWDDEDKSLWADLLFTHFIEPGLKGLVIVEQYPAEMCALARVAPNVHGQMVARRFEVFWNGVELANGYWELTDAVEQERRFKQDLTMRKRQGKPHYDFDEKFLAALKAGMPECAGVALGVDRLLMCMLGQSDIAKVMPFADG